MDFVSGLPLTTTKNDSIWVILDRLTNSAHFILVRIDYSLQKLAKLYIYEIAASDRRKSYTDCLKAASDRRKSYTDLERSDIDYSVGDFVFLKVSLWKKVPRFGRKGKLSPRFIGPYQILKHVGPVVYQLALRLELNCIHDIFHVSMLRRYRYDPSYVVSVEEIEVRPNLTFEEEPIHILGRDVKVLRRKSISLVKVLWQNHGTEEAMWELEYSMCQ
ncbi:uncharacterized protein LOC108487790 [Gossypium arboreum]|uniref:uncharacterized protein LOC108487790 n=1 Tax=Gossypium arboreum TaxID=29729 RepID=UPI0008197172|nr:uncharacterized protein LOC108487790 [Gossypium arboreum]